MSHFLVTILHRPSPTPKGLPGRIRARRERWTETISALSPRIKRMLKEGCPLLWKNGPPPPKTLVGHRRQAINPDLEEWVTRCKETGFIEEVAPGFAKVISPVFTIRKPDGGFRVIVDLRYVNKFQEVPKFKLEGYNEVRKLIKQGYFVARIDLKDAFFSFFNNEASTPYTCVRVGTKIYVHRSLTMGSSASPYLFHKMMRPIVGQLRATGVTLISYVDDILIIGKSRQICQNNVTTTQTLFQELGFEINTKKSDLVPSQETKFLGFLIKTRDTPSMSLPKLTRERIAHELERMTRRRVTAVQIARICGLANFASSVVLGARTLTRGLHDLLKSKVTWHSTLTLDDSHKTNALLLAKLIRMNPHKPLSELVEAELICDASPSGMGAVCFDARGKVLLQISKNWSRGEKRHINILELLTIFKALKQLPSHIKVVRVKSDNTTALSYVRRLAGRVSSLHTIATKILHLCLARGLSLKTEFIPGKENIHADALSRLKQLPVTDQLSKMLGNHSKILFPSPNALQYAMQIPGPKIILVPDWKAHFLHPLLQETCDTCKRIPTCSLQSHPEWPTYVKRTKFLLAFSFRL